MNDTAMPPPPRPSSAYGLALDGRAERAPAAAPRAITPPDATMPTPPPACGLAHDDVVSRLLAARGAAERNAAVLDSMSAAAATPPKGGGPAPPAEPISKHLLGALFGGLGRVGEDGRYVYVGNEHGSHFLYGLVVPLLARMLAASCPGLCVVVQLPGELSLIHI